MKTLNRFLGSFKTKITLALVLSMLFVGTINNFLIYKFSLNSQFNAVRKQLEIIAQTAALMIDADILTQVPLNREGFNSPQFNIIADTLRKIKQANQPIKFIYILKKTEKQDVCQVVVDLDPVNERNKSITSYPGDKYDASRFPAMIQGFDKPSADYRLQIDEWGAALSGYAPIRDKNGKSVAVLGVDITANELAKSQKEIHRRAIFVLILGLVISFVLGMFISTRITRPIRRLVEGTHNISGGNLNYQVDIKGSDEIVELANSFNDMAKSLHSSRQKLLDYFYRVVQSLIRILEARDHYTMGHSERVSEYAQKIALKMGFTQDKVEALSKIALLHDIGKLGIRDSILNKPGKLTPQEWEEIHKHPVIGEEILKPVLLNEEMLAIIRGHHERFDGKGYPDKISGDNINIFAAILSVADAYDAMTSQRAYRAALDKQEAVAEIKRNKSIQFNPKAVDALLSVLQEEDKAG